MAVAVDLLHGGHRVSVDMEDWFSEDLLPEAKTQRPVRLIRSLEKELLSQSVYSSCPSVAMSDALAQKYECHAPAVIYNAFPWTERQSIDGAFKDRALSCLPTIHWFSQTIGEGRGLEDLFAALAYLKTNVEIHLRGAPAAGFDHWLSRHAPGSWRTRIHIHDQVPNDELLSRIAEHDIGFAGEMKFCRSRDLTITNKILQYLLAGLAVVASDTAGQREVAEKAPGAVLLYKSGDPSALAASIDTLLASAEVLRRAKAAALKAAERVFCWERQEKALTASIVGSLNSPSRRESK